VLQAGRGAAPAACSPRPGKAGPRGQTQHQSASPRSASPCPQQTAHSCEEADEMGQENPISATLCIFPRFQHYSLAYVPEVLKHFLTLSVTNPVPFQLVQLPSRYPSMRTKPLPPPDLVRKRTPLNAAFERENPQTSSGSEPCSTEPGHSLARLVDGFPL